jgi:hypothetical protein
MNRPKVVDNDEDEVTVTYRGHELRGWSYANDTERRTKMLCAWEYIEGWCDGYRWCVQDEDHKRDLRELRERDPDLARDQRRDDKLWDEQNG